MATITKKEMVDRIAEQSGCKRLVVKGIIQSFLDGVVDELASGNRCEFREFGVFECRVRPAREAQNPKTMRRVVIPQKRSIKFKPGRGMKIRLQESDPQVDPATGLPIDSAAHPPRRPQRNRDGVVPRTPVTPS